MTEKSGFHKQASRAIVEDTTLPEMGSPEESIPRSIVPYSRDDDRSRYLGLRASGFSIREALGLIAKAKSTLSAWRQDPEFVKLENDIPALRKTLALEYAGLEFLRNYRLVLEKDFRVIKGSLKKETFVDDHGKEHKIPQDSQDFQYLLKMRPHYTPQQLQAIEQLFGRDTEGKDFNWTDFVLEMSRTTEKVKIETRRKQEPELATVEEEFDELPELCTSGNEGTSKGHGKK
jgi:hypothetical protein